MEPHSPKDPNLSNKDQKYWYRMNYITCKANNHYCHVHIQARSFGCNQSVSLPTAPRLVHT